MENQASQEILASREGYKTEIIAVVSMTNDDFTANANLIASAPRMIEFIKQLAKEGDQKAKDFLQTLDLS